MTDSLTQQYANNELINRHIALIVNPGQAADSRRKLFSLKPNSYTAKAKFTNSEANVVKRKNNIPFKDKQISGRATDNFFQQMFYNSFSGEQLAGYVNAPILSAYDVGANKGNTNQLTLATGGTMQNMLPAYGQVIPYAISSPGMTGIAGNLVVTEDGLTSYEDPSILFPQTYARDPKDPLSIAFARSAQFTYQMATNKTGMPITHTRFLGNNSTIAQPSDLAAEMYKGTTENANDKAVADVAARVNKMSAEEYDQYIAGGGVGFNVQDQAYQAAVARGLIQPSAAYLKAISNGTIVPNLSGITYNDQLYSGMQVPPEKRVRLATTRSLPVNVPSGALGVKILQKSGGTLTTNLNVGSTNNNSIAYVNTTSNYAKRLRTMGLDISAQQSKVGLNPPTGTDAGTQANIVPAPIDMLAVSKGVQTSFDQQPEAVLPGMVANATVQGSGPATLDPSGLNDVGDRNTPGTYASPLNTYQTGFARARKRNRAETTASNFYNDSSFDLSNLYAGHRPSQSAPQTGYVRGQVTEINDRVSRYLSKHGHQQQGTPTKTTRSGTRRK